MKILRIWLYTFIATTLLVGVVACGQTAATPTAVPTAMPSPTATIAVVTLQPGDLERTLTVNGVERNYLLHIPSGLDSTKPVPVVFALHGYDNEIYFEISDLQNMTGFNDIADQSGFLLVYPKGISGVWNAGTCCGIAAENNVDEAAFVRQILSDLGTITSVDAKRIYATGFSVGGMLSYRLACEMSDTFAAIAPVAGALVYDPCQPGQPVSVLQVHGKSDTAIPYAGGVGLFMSGNNVFPPVEQEIATWVQLDGCTGSAQVETQGITTHTVYASCQAGTAVELYTLEALGSNWPSQYVLPISQMIWDFFAAHPKQ